MFRALALILIAGGAAAEERPLAGNEIAALLPTIVALGTGTRQTFSAAGATTYSQGGRDSFGSWEVRGDRYCSRWPPADGWACYDVMRDGETLVWVGESRARTVNRIAPR